MTAFARAVEVVLAQEGGYANDAHDPGGETNFGISKRRFPDEDIKDLTRERAIELYHEHYWRATGCDRLPERIAIAYLDACVNHGEGAGSAEIPGGPRLLQRAVRHFRDDVVEDGTVGPVTERAVWAIDSKALLAEFLARRAQRYAEITTFPTFGHTWMRRLFDVHQAALIG